MIVPDTNLIGYLLIDGAQSNDARRVFERDSDWVVPPLWKSEFRNVLVTSVRARVLTNLQARRVWETGEALLTGTEYEPDGAVVLNAALEFGISAYDAEFVALAQSLDVVVVSGDQQLSKRCPKRVILISEFAELPAK